MGCGFIIFLSSAVSRGGVPWPEPDRHLRLALGVLEQKEFQATKHGAGCFRLDRTSLYVTGPLANLYEESVCSSVWLRGWLFACVVCRSCLNDSDSMQRFVLLWKERIGGLPDANGFLRHPAAPDILRDAWGPNNDMGYGPRALPQCHMGKRGTFEA